jgi:uncharacterized protein (DUF1499 family)
MFTILLVLVALVIAGFAGLGWWSNRDGEHVAGLVGGRLAPCGPAPNCVCSEAGADVAQGIAPLPLTGTEWDRVAAVVGALGGHIVQQDAHYLHATFTSRLLRFVDDLELRQDGAAIQVRSASRVGHSDLGVNRRRVEALRSALAATPTTRR